jgi:hypothetical protein
MMRDAQKVVALRDALQQIIANTEEDAIRHMGHDGLTAYEALAKAVHDCAKAALDEVDR